MLFTALALYVLAAFTASLAPEKPYAVPTAVCLLLSSLHFAKFSRAAMLEMGYVFFILLAFYGAFRAAEDPRYWIVWALGCGLGTLHKVPMALGLSSLWILALRYTGHLKGESRFWRENWFRAGLLLNVMLCSSWAIIQTIKFGPLYRRGPVSRWIFRMTTGVDGREGEGLRWDLTWLEWFVEDSVPLWILVSTVLIIAACRPDTRRDSSLWCLLVPAVPVIVGFTFSGGPFYSRYILTFSPFFVIAAAIFLCKIINNRYLPFLVSLLVFFSAGENYAAANYKIPPETTSNLRWVGTRIKTHLREDEAPLFVRFDEPYPALYGFLGHGRPFLVADGHQLDLEESENYLAVISEERKSHLSNHWTGSEQEIETVGRFAVVRLGPKAEISPGMGDETTAEPG